MSHRIRIAGGMNQLQPEPINLRTGIIASSRLRQFCQLSPARQFPACPPRVARGQAGLLEDKLCPNPKQNRKFTMNAEEKISWLNDHAGWRRWRAGDAVRCRLCGHVFKAEQTASDIVGEPTCPHCISSTVSNFENVK